jgi:hypothetical protein
MLPLMKYYSKTLPKTPLMLPKGKFKFEEFPDGYGYLSTANEMLIAALSDLISRNIGGVKEITQEVYEEAIKKNATAQPKKPSIRDQGPKLVPPPAVNPRQPRGFQSAKSPAPERKAAGSAVRGGADELPLPSPFKSAVMKGFSPNVDKLLANIKRK